MYLSTSISLITLLSFTAGTSYFSFVTRFSLAPLLP